MIMLFRMISHRYHAIDRRLFMKEYQSPEFEIVRIVFNRDVMVYLASVETDIPDIDDEM